VRLQNRIDEVSMLLDLSACIGCRACQVACNEWNGLPVELTGSCEHPTSLSGDTWMQVRVIERQTSDGFPEWLLYSDSCKHCREAPCMVACPTGAIVRTDEGMIVVNENVCNGNGHCVPACPFGVIGLSKKTGIAGKCTFCYERVAEGLETACTKVCPTACIQFGERKGLIENAHRRIGLLRERGADEARLYGEHELGGLHVLYVLTCEPSVYGLPDPLVAPRERLGRAALATAAVALLWGCLYLLLTSGNLSL